MVQSYTLKTSLDVYQTAAVRLIEYACGWSKGRDKDDPVYVEVTEGRDGPGPVQRKTYSSCADLFHWLMKRFDVEELWVNRTDDHVHGDWKVGENVSKLAWCDLAFTPGKDWTPSPGDCLMVWDNTKGTDAHVMVTIGATENPFEWRMGNYGAGGMSPAVSPGAKISSKPLKWNGHHWVYGTRTVRRSIRLADALKFSRGGIDLTGSPNTPEDDVAQTTGEELDAIEGKLK